MNLDKLRDKLYDENTHIRKRLYVLTVFITLVAMFITILEVVFTDTSYLNTILLVVGFIFTIFLAVLSVKYNKIRLASIIESILMGFVYVPMTFFWGGGVYGDAPVWFLFSVLFSYGQFLGIREKRRLRDAWISRWWAGMDSNHRSREAADLQSAPFNHSGTYPQW